MKRSTKAGMRILVALLLAAVGVSPAGAGGPRVVDGLGEPMRWDTTGPVLYNPDPGALGVMNNAEARSLLTQAFAEWASQANITFAEGALLPQDVDAEGIPSGNPAHYANFLGVAGDGLSPVIFDVDGSIIDALAGNGARFELLGIGGLDTPLGLCVGGGTPGAGCAGDSGCSGGTCDPSPIGSEITEASIVINGAFFDGEGLPSSPDDLSETALKALMVHEIGHFINLEHSLLNHELALDGNPGNDIYVPTMFPVAVDDDEALATTNPDDWLAAQSLYPFGPAGDSIAGSVASAGVPFQGANVVLRKVGDPWMTAYSLLSGGRFYPCNAGSTCDPCSDTPCNPGSPPEQGAFAADFLAPGSYQICVEQIDTRTSLGPLETPPILLGPEECHDAAEAGTQSDDPDSATAVLAGGATVVDILLDALPASDPFEPNDTLGSGTVLDDLPAGRDTAPGVLSPNDLDVFQVPVVAGQRVRIDIDAAELGSSLDAVVGFYDASNNLVALVDDAIDPDSAEFSVDPALELTADFSGMGKIVVSSFPDLDQDGHDGATTGPHWIRVEVASDTDGDGAEDEADICPLTAKDDADRDGLCFGADNCPTDNNPSQDAPLKISGPMVFGGDVDSFALSLDEASVVYVADQAADDVFQLYAVPVAGGPAPLRLNPDLGVSPQDVTAFLISPDGATVVYLADQDTDETFELYRVAIGGGVVTKLNGTLPPGGNVLEFNISPDGSRVVYRADQDTPGTDELYSVPIGGGATTKLNGTMTPGGSIGDPGAGFSSFLFSEDSTRVIYVADEITVGVFEIFSVPIAGGAATKLNGPLVPGGNVAVFRTDHVSTRIVYSADQDTDGRVELYSVPIAGGPVTKISGVMPGGAAGIASFRITADGATAVYRADQNSAGEIEIYSVPAGGGPSTKLNPALVAGGDVTGFALPVGAGDGSRLSYRADQEVDERFELYSVPITGGSAVKLNAPLAAGGNVTLFGNGIYDSRVLYFADQDTDEQFEAYSVPADGGTPVKLLGTMVAGGDAQSGSFDAARMAIGADKEVDDVVELFGVRVAGGVPLELNAPLVPGGDVTAYDFVGNGARIVYLADQDADEVFELYSRPFSLDTDADGIFDRCDLCFDVANASQDDADGNGIGDACAACPLGTDPDGDGACDASDNCPTVANSLQDDFDLDGAGDECDADDDDDGLADVVETDTGTFVSGDDTGTDPFDADSDNDGVSDGDEVTGGTDPNAAAEAGAGVPFHPRRTIAAAADGAFSVFAADIDGDGDMDALSASNFDGKIAWYENDGAAIPSWTAHTITSAADGASSVFAADVDGDGDMDALSASVFDDKIAWYENDGAAIPSWTAHTITSAADGASSVFAADVDGDGDMDALSASSVDNKIAWYENDGAPTPSWIAHTITTAADGARSVFAADVDGDGDMDALSASEDDDKIAWYENDGAPTPGWIVHTITTAADGASSVFAADVDGDGDMDALSASYIDDKIAWYENDGAAIPGWTAHTITSAADQAFSVFAADVDGDGDIDALGASLNDPKIAWYENDGAAIPGWTAHTITSAGVGAFSVFAEDVDGDGDMDAFSAEQDDKIAWYGNLTIHRNAAFPAEITISPETTTGFDRPLAIGDVDRDGDLDVVVGNNGAVSERTRLFLNNGSADPFDGVTGVDATNDSNTLDVALGDVDDDGDLDLVVGTATGSRLYLNNGTANPWNGVGGSSIGGDALFASRVLLGDVDRDGDLDLVALGFASRLYLNNGTADPWNGVGGIAISGTVGLFGKLGDVDGDGDLDLVNISDGAVNLLFLNNGTADPWNGVAGVNITDDTDRTTDVALVDVDRDGDLDFVAGNCCGELPRLYLNDGTAAPWAGAVGAQFGSSEAAVVAIGDFDRDGDPDLVKSGFFQSQEVFLSNGTSNPWGASGIPIGTPQDIRGMAVGDMDGDGDLDIVSGTSAFSAGINYYPNRGGQFSLDTTVLAPASILDGSTAAVLGIEMTSNGGAGDSPVELATLDLAVTDASGTTLTSDEANALIERVRVYLDDGSSTFDPGFDTLVAEVETLQLSPLVIEFAPGNPKVRVASGQTKTFFVAVTAAVGASGKNPNVFRVKHLAQSGSTARDTATGALIEMEFAQDGSTATISAVADTAPPFVTGVFPPSGAVDVSLATDVQLFMSEPVEPASAALGLLLSSGGVKVSGHATTSKDGLTVGFDADAPLAPGTTYLLEVSGALRDLSGNPAIPFTSTLETTSSSSSGNYGADDFGAGGGGATIVGGNANDKSGFAVAALGDVNAVSGGIADLIVGAPNAGEGDEGAATLYFGSPLLQSNAGGLTSITYETGTPGDHIGETVARAGDVNGDGVQDFLIGAPQSDQAGTDAGVVYLVFGSTLLGPATFNLDDLAACSVPTLCGVEFHGEDPGDLAGQSMSYAGDVDGDGHDDLVIGAPGAAPGGKSGAGKAYLIYGPLAAGTISLCQVGSPAGSPCVVGPTARGLELRGESAGDHLGASVSQWEDAGGGDGIDDLLLGAPDATALDELGAPVLNGGYVYAILGGTGAGKLDDTATPGEVELSRLANGGADEIAGMVFLGDKPGGNLGRSVTGAIDIDGDGVKDVLMAGNGVAFSIPGNDPKTITGGTRTGGQNLLLEGMTRAFGLLSALDDLDGVRYLAGDDDPLTVGAGGDMNHDGYDDFIIGAPLANGTAGLDSGKAYVVLGSPAPGGTDQALDDVGQTIAGFIVEGEEEGDNLGASVGGGFDVNADGIDDGLAGAPFADTTNETPQDAGETYVISPLAPEEVMDLTLQKLAVGVRLEWKVTNLSASYNVYRGLLINLRTAGIVRTSDMDQLDCGISTDADGDQLPDTDDTDEMPPVPEDSAPVIVGAWASNAFVYLVTSENFLGEGPLGPPGAVPPRINDAQCP